MTIIGNSLVNDYDMGGYPVKTQPGVKTSPAMLSHKWSTYVK